MATRGGFGIRFHESDARPIGRTARGVRAIELKSEDDEVVGMCALAPDADPSARILTVSETGNGRRSELSEYRCQTRGGKGSTNYKTEKNGKVVSVCLVGEDDDVILISSDGIVIRIPAAQINTNSRTSKGVRVMKVTPGEAVVSAAPIAREETDDGDDEDTDEQGEEI